MSTRNVKPQADAARKSLVALSETAKERTKRIDRQLEENNGKRDALGDEVDSIQHGAAVAIQAVMDDVDRVDQSDARLLEERGQLNPDLTPPAESTTPPAQPDAPADADPNPAPANPAPEPAPQAATTPINQPGLVGIAPAQPVPIHEHNPINPLNWGWIQWVFAVIGLIVMLGIASWLGSWFYYGWVFGVNGLFGTIFTILFWAALPAFGFFGGGLLGYIIDRNRLRRHGVDIEVVMEQRRARRRQNREVRRQQNEARLAQYRQAQPVPPAEPPVA